MKNLLVVFAISLLAAPGWSQNSFVFTNLAPMPSPRGAIATCADDKALYVCNGFSNTDKYTGLLERYDIAENSWTTISTTLIPKQFTSCALMNEHIYVFNGNLADMTFNKKMEVVDLKTGEVTFAKKNPQPAHAAGVVVWQGKIYSFGGKIATDVPDYTDRLYEFDPTKNKWKQLASMKEKKETKGAVVEGRIYTIGGYNGKASDKVHVYDIATDKWIELLKLPFGISANSVVAYGNKIYSLFDFTNQTLIGCYDIASNTFAVCKQENMIGRRHAGAQILNGKLYIMGGNTSHLQNSCLGSLQVAELK